MHSQIRHHEATSSKGLISGAQLNHPQPSLSSAKGIEKLSMAMDYKRKFPMNRVASKPLKSLKKLIPRSVAIIP
ncbi:hypothetical protein AMTR_s00009p00137200 [Amborella trichopoda]|uniref:Uncharacterized protein n=1 Tax=Amborella trichopoda TaxID=13333 RepID=W1NHD6_AMBTC|nr:hypothetical protein AMTR_s00009p00137200 [Amborella trichopoda]